MSALHTYLYGPEDGPEILALHGVTGHGRRWETLAHDHVPEARWIAPDLLGHGRSTWSAPWNIEAHVAAVVDTLKAHARGPVVVVGHSFGGALAVHLANVAPERVRALVLLDPAIGLDGDLMSKVAELTISSPDYTDAAEARAEKRGEAWADVPAHVLDAEIDEHLIELDNGRVNWRMSVPAVVAVWGELAREYVLPPNVPTALVPAKKVQPPYTTEKFRAALRERLGENLTTTELDCDHMVPQARPDDVAGILRNYL
ncbi:alpha/beta fold hydrolase [Rhodococcus sp. NPDC058521]|uniref:alpha/beta fold hydrolase n=1 Tax=Rhodococcus sp. NPDC058521 TaxID=3346536 RepID=UPI00364FC8FC